jgi:transposase
MSTKMRQPWESTQGKSLSEDKKWDIVAVMQRCKLENEISPTVSTKDPRKRTAAYLGTGENVVSQIYSHYQKYGTVPMSRQGNHTNHETIIPTDVELSIRNYLRTRILENRYTTANDVINFVDEAFNLKVNVRTMRRTLSRLGMQWRKNTTKGKIYRESEEVVQKRRDYLHALAEYRNLPTNEQYVEIWTDESYIHHHHAFNYSWYGVSDFTDRKHKGRRLVILAAGSKHGFVPNSLKVYCAQKPTGDYHGNISKTIYSKWFTESLLPNLSQKSLIIMDNASYHTALPDSAPRLNATKSQIKTWLQQYNVSFKDHELLDTLRLKLKQQVIPKIKPYIVEIAESRGHKVLFQPPHHSDLQAIELIWANVKGEVARKYDNATTFKQVEERLLDAFTKVTSELWADVIQHVRKKEISYWETDQHLYDSEIEVDNEIIDENDDYIDLTKY